MATTVVFDLLSDDEDLAAAIAEVGDDPVLKWELALFCCQLMLKRAVASRALARHYSGVRERAAATRAARTAVS